MDEYSLQSKHVPLSAPSPQQGSLRGAPAPGQVHQGGPAPRALRGLRPPGVVRHVGADGQGRRVRDAPGRPHRGGFSAIRHVGRFLAT